LCHIAGRSQTSGCAPREEPAKARAKAKPENKDQEKR
jgi:hypothetical protein